MAADLYTILGVARNASPEDIKLGYRRACARVHPDRGGSEEAQKEVNAAYEILSNPARRRHYDRTGLTEEPQGLDAMAEDLLMLIWDDVLAVCFENPMASPLAVARDIIDRKQDEMNKSHFKRLEAIEFLKRQGKRLRRRRAGNNLYEIAAMARLETLEKIAKVHKLEIEIVQRTRKLLDDYSHPLELGLFKGMDGFGG